MPRSAGNLRLGTRAGRVTLPLLAALISCMAMQPLYAQKSSKNTKAAQASDEAASVQAGIDTVLAFYKAVANADFEQARQYIGHYYIEHDPAREDGIDGLRKALNPSRIGVRKTFTIERLVGDGEYVILHAKLMPLMIPPGGAAPSGNGPPPAAPGPAPGAAPGAAAPAGGGPPSMASGAAPPPELRPSEVAEIFRLFDGKIVEHWKVIQQS